MQFIIKFLLEDDRDYNRESLFVLFIKCVVYFIDFVINLDKNIFS